MPLDPRVKRFLDYLAAADPPDARTATIEARRAGMSAIMKLAGPESPVAGVEDRQIAGPQGALPVRLYSPHDSTAAMPGLIYFHGGGLVAGSVATHDCIARALAYHGAVRVVSVDYRLAPEHPFPAALDDAICAVRHVHAHASEFGIDDSRLGICGDSAGATLAAATCQWAVRAGNPPLALQLLICPILDYSRETASRRTFASGYLVDQATLDHDLLHYLPTGVDAADPRISPLRAAAVSGMPRTLIHTAEFDPLRDEGREYAEHLRGAHNEVSYTCHPGMIHLFYGMGTVVPYARTAFERIGGEIRAALALPQELLMVQRIAAQQIIQQLHAARVSGDIDGMCGVFAADGRFEILGAGADKSIAIRADNLAGFRPWLSMMVKVFRLSNYELLSLVVEWPRATAHWRADIYSKVTGVTVPTELADLVLLDAGRITAYTEFFAPR